MEIVSTKEIYMLDAYVLEVKAIAKQKIIDLIPGANKNNYIEKEMNLLMRSNELLNLKVDGNSSEEISNQIEINKLLAVGIKAIRSASDLIEAELNNNILYNYKQSNIWPE